MIGFLQKITFLILNIQEAVLKQCMPEIKRKNSLSKNVYGACATLTLNAKSKMAKEKIESNLESLILKHKNSPKDLLKLVEKKGTKVYKINNADKILKIISQETGFITEKYGLKALFINAVTKNNVSFKSDAMFIIDENKFDQYKTLQHVYKWYSNKMNMSGFDAKSQDNFNKYITGCCENIDNLSIDEIIGLKDAIARDVEAISFVVKMAKSTESSKKALQKMVQSGAVI